MDEDLVEMNSAFGIASFSFDYCLELLLSCFTLAEVLLFSGLSPSLS